MKSHLPEHSAGSCKYFILGCVLITALAACVKLPRRAPALLSQNESLGGSAVQVPAARTNINTATERGLEQLPGIGKALAARIIEHREKYGPFRRAEHLMMVRGISEGRFRQMRHLITVE